MPEKDYIIFGETFSYKGLFDMAEFYKVLKKWFFDNQYIFGERQYRDLIEGLNVKWVAYKKMNDYVKKYVEIDIITKDLQKVKLKTKSMNKGQVSLEFKSYLEKDYEESWVGAITRFIRAIYDVFIKSPEIEQFEKELK